MHCHRCLNIDASTPMTHHACHGIGDATPFRFANDAMGEIRPSTPIRLIDGVSLIDTA
jgi:hypothetical protein